MGRIYKNLIILKIITIIAITIDASNTIDLFFFNSFLFFFIIIIKIVNEIKENGSVIIGVPIKIRDIIAIDNEIEEYLLKFSILISSLFVE